MTTADKTWPTDPGNYTEYHLLVNVPAEVLVQIRQEAHEAYERAGGHSHAARMNRVVHLVDAEFERREHN